LEQKGSLGQGPVRRRLWGAVPGHLALGIAHRRALWRKGFSYLDRFVPSLHIATRERAPAFPKMERRIVGVDDFHPHI
jgi:hypothetical protein